MTKIDLQEILSKVDNMESLPHVVGEIMDLAENPDSTIQDMERLILMDQALTGRVLRLANSAYYSYARNISTISQATILLGFQTVKTIALASTFNSYLNHELKGYALDKNQLWRQSQTCAIASRYIAKKVGYKDPEEAYIAGLLRDIGKTILNDNMEKDYKKVLDLVEENQMSFIDAEKEVFGFDHGEIGSKLAMKWNFPANLVDTIKNHHNPELSEEDSNLVHIIHIADGITMMMGVGLGLDGLSYNLSETSIRKLGLGELEVENIIAEIIDLISDEDSFNLD